MKYLSLPAWRLDREQDSDVEVSDHIQPLLSLPADPLSSKLNLKHQLNQEKQLQSRRVNKKKHQQKHPELSKDEDSVIMTSQKSETHVARETRYQVKKSQPSGKCLKNESNESFMGRTKAVDILNPGRQGCSVNHTRMMENCDPRQETNPKMVYGGDENGDDTEEKKLRKDLSETEKAKPAETEVLPTPTVSPDIHSPDSIVDMVRSGELTPDASVSKQMQKAVLNVLNQNCELKRQNELNTILTWVSSLKHKGQNEGMVGRIDVGVINCVPEKTLQGVGETEEIITMEPNTGHYHGNRSDHVQLGMEKRPIEKCDAIDDGLVDEPMKSSGSKDRAVMEFRDCENLQEKICDIPCDEARRNQKKRTRNRKPRFSKLMKSLDIALKRVESDEDGEFPNTVIKLMPAQATIKNKQTAKYMYQEAFINDRSGKSGKQQYGRSRHGRNRRRGIMIKRVRYLELKMQAAPVRRHSGGQGSGGGGASSYHGNGGSNGLKGSSDHPLKGKHSRKGSNRGDGDGQDDDEPKDQKNYDVTNNNCTSDIDESGDRRLDNTTPAPNYKKFRKKPDDDCGHGDPDGGILEALGLLSSEKLDFESLDDLSRDILNQLNNCLVQCLLAVDNGVGQDVVPHCLICPIITRLFHHFVSETCMKTKPGECETCDQVFALMKFHLFRCCTSPSLGVDCVHTLTVCRRIHRQGLAYADRPDCLEKYLWDKLKELLARLFNDVEVTAPQRTFQRRKPLSRKVSSRGTLKRIPEHDTHHAEDNLDSAPSQQASVPGTNTNFSQREDSEISQSDILIYNLPEHPAPLPPKYTVVYNDSNPTYTVQGCLSMPTAHGPRLLGDQLMSFEDRPTGEPGIGEVVYGSRRHLRNIAEHWTHMKQKSYTGEKFPRVSREEGIILNQHKDKLEIGKTRYQEGVQWERTAQLGRGVSGRCYLAYDVTTECQFCVKEILITSYHEDELLIWSNLKHNNVVQLYGAIRYDTYIYILAELIDGGCLTEHIYNQRELNRRLSKAVALRYFKQLLEVLEYLQANNVLHEDLKADNILLRNIPPSAGQSSGQAEIVVADFGLARQVQPGERVGKTTPIGSQTQWSPEKAASEGYDFRSDVWAATCVLVHIFNGQPPWVRRYSDAAVLHYVISNNSPPVEDMPNNVTEDIKHLIHRGWTVDLEKRPFAKELLTDINLDYHPTAEIYFSTIISMGPISDLQSNNPGTFPDPTGPDEGSDDEEEEHQNGGTSTSQTQPETPVLPATVSATTPTTTPGAQIEASVEQGHLGIGSQDKSVSWNSSDPQQHIALYCQDDGASWMPVTALPNLPLFKETVSVEGTLEGEVTVSGGAEVTEISSPHRNKIRSASSPNIFLQREESPTEGVFNSEDLFGSGSPTRSEEIRTAVPGVPIGMSTSGLNWQYTQARTLSHSPEVSNIPQPTSQPQSHASPPQLHLDLGRPGHQLTPRTQLRSVPSEPAMRLATGQSNVGGRSGMPYTASPTVRQTAPGIGPIPSTQDPTRSSPLGSSNSANTSGGSPRVTDSQAGTPKSSTYEHQDRELQTIAKEMIEVMLVDQKPNTPGIMELSQSLCSDEQEEEAEIVPESFEEYQHSLNYSQPENNGTLIKFVCSTSGKLLTQVRIRDMSKEWYEVIVDIASPMIHSRDFRSFCVLHQDDSVVDMNALVGSSDVTVKVVALMNEEEARTWFIKDHKFHWN